jgi:hypothetical protein
MRKKIKLKGIYKSGGHKRCQRKKVEKEKRRDSDS